MNRISLSSSFIMASAFFVPCLVLSFALPQVGRAEASGGYPSGEGIEDSITDGDTTASMDGLIDWWKANSGLDIGVHKPGYGECRKVVGLRFDFSSSWDPVGDYRSEGEETDDAEIFYCAVDTSGEKITGDQPGSVTDLYWSFQATVFYECTASTLTLTADPASIEVDEDSTVDIQVGCADAGGVGGMTVNLWLSEGSPGELNQHEVTTDDSGHASVTFHSDANGTATVNGQILACSGTENIEIVNSTCMIEVGGRKLQVDLIYISELNVEDFSYNSSFVHRMEIALVTDDSGQVTGDGTGKTAFDFDYEGEEVYSDNWNDSGFNTCTAEGTYDSDTGMYLLNIDTEGSISFDHVVRDENGQEIMRIPIQEDVDWEQICAEPIEISDDPDSVFTASGSIAYTEYTIIARWVSGTY